MKKRIKLYLILIVFFLFISLTLGGNIRQPFVSQPKIAAAGDVWFDSVTDKEIGNIFETDLYVDTGSQILAAYSIDIAYNQNVIVVETSIGTSGVEAGSDGFVSAVDVSTPGVITIMGFDLMGTGPDSQLHLLRIWWEAIAVGTSPLDITIDSLVNDLSEDIGTPTDIDGSVIVVEDLPIGDVWFGTVPDKEVGDIFETQIYVNTGIQRLSQYSFDIVYNQNVIIVDTSVGDNGVEEVADGFSTYVDIDTPGVIEINGFNSVGTEPSSQLHLLNITWIAVAVGTSPLNLTIYTLADHHFIDIGTPTDIDGSIEVVEDVTLGDVWVGSVPTKEAGDIFETQIYVNTGSQKIADYEINIAYNQNVIVIDTSIGNNGVEAGTDGFVSAVDASSPGLINISGFDTMGTGPGSQLHLLNITWIAVAVGTSLLDITVDTLIDPDTNVIGKPTGIDGIIYVTDHIAPLIKINFPFNNTYHSNPPIIQVSIFDLSEINTTWYNFPGYSENKTFSGNSINIEDNLWNDQEEGFVLIRIFANDSLGNLGQTDIKVIKDTIQPFIRVISPLEGDIYGGDAPEFNITVSDLHPDILYYTINNTAPKYFVPFSSGTNIIVINESAWDILPEGQVLINFFINDTAGNTNYTGVTLKKEFTSTGETPAISGYNTFTFLIIGAIIIIILFFRKRKQYMNRKIYQ